jgi:hypothetical protein
MSTIHMAATLSTLALNRMHVVEELPIWWKQSWWEERTWEAGMLNALAATPSLRRLRRSRLPQVNRFKDTTRQQH